MPSWFGRRVIEGTGPAAGTPAAAIQEHYLVVIRAGERRDAEGQLAEMNRMVEAARGAGFAEVVAAMNRYRLALGDHPMEPPELAVKAVTLAVHALPFRPRPGSAEARLLNAWGVWDITARTLSDQYKPATEAFVNAIKAAQAQKVLAALMLFLQAPNGLALYTALGAVGLKVYQAAYHRDPPSKEAFGF
ncbi:MAG: hypothetical protein ABSC46_12510 [Candidatus Limnocylindrales bacterium]